jgi:glycosyltransferase involved in cell wall biosynthesis
MQGQFSDHVNLFLAVSGFLRNKMIEGGYDPAKIDVLENGVPLPHDTSSSLVGSHVAYVGRMQVEKGVETLLKVARRLPACKFVFVGDGPERAGWEAASTANCSFLGRQGRGSAPGHTVVLWPQEKRQAKTRLELQTWLGLTPGPKTHGTAWFFSSPGPPILFGLNDAPVSRRSQ